MTEATQTSHSHGISRVDREAESLMRSATYAAVSTAGILVVIKAIAWWFTGSVALLGSLFDSMLDVAVSLVNMIAVRKALLPRDEEHRFGHGKVEALAGLGQALIIALSALYLVYECLQRIGTPKSVENGLIGVVVIVISIILTLLLVRFQRKVIQRSGSLVISADELHYKGDLLMNVAVIAALLLSGIAGLPLIDPAIGLGVAVYIVWAAWTIVRQSYDQLMDREFPDDKRMRVRDMAMKHPDVLDVHDLRTRSAGRLDFIQLHLELDADISLVRAHEIADEVEEQLLNTFPRAEIIIHQDPAGLEEITALDKR